MPVENLFRDKALERLASPPEQLEASLHLVRPSAWSLLLGLFCLIAGAVAWGVYGRVPVTVSGRGVILRPRQVTSLQSPATGLIGHLNLKVGGHIKAGDVIGTIEQPALRKQIELEKAKLKELQEDTRNAASRREERRKMEKRFCELQHKEIQNSIQEVGDLAEKVRAVGGKSVEAQRAGYQKLIQRNEELLRFQKERLERYRDLQRQGFVSSEGVAEAEAACLLAGSRLVDLDMQVQQLTVQTAQNETTYLEKLQQTAALRERARVLDVQEQKAIQEDLAAAAGDDRQIREVERTISRLESDLLNQSRIVSEHTGRVLELSAGPGQVVTQGSRLGALEVEDRSGELICLSYFAVKDGKLLKEGSPVQITLDTVKRERFGSLLGEVRSVSPFPVSAESAAHVIGNQQLAAELTAQFRQIEVAASLRPDPRTPSGYAWSSMEGPHVTLTAGTTATVSAVVEERAPITFLLPFVRSATGR